MISSSCNKKSFPHSLLPRLSTQGYQPWAMLFWLQHRQVASHILPITQKCQDFSEFFLRVSPQVVWWVRKFLKMFDSAQSINEIRARVNLRIGNWGGKHLDSFQTEGKGKTFSNKQFWRFPKKSWLRSRPGPRGTVTTWYDFISSFPKWQKRILFDFTFYGQPTCTINKQPHPIAASFFLLSSFQG